VLLASAVAVVHGAAVVFMVCGVMVCAGLPALPRRRLLYLHVAVALAILAVNLAAAPCPLTDLELALRARAGGPAYTGGFLGHYLFRPLGWDSHRTAVRVGEYLVAVVPNAVGYGLLAVRALRSRRVRRA
jgi:Protein of Unknown function (DUF2784)